MLTSPSTPSSRTRLLILGALCAVLVLVAGVYTARAARRGTAAGTPPVPPEAGALAHTDLASGPRLAFLEAGTNPLTTAGRVMMVPLAQPDGPRSETGVRCQRVYAHRDTSLCLTISQTLTGGKSAQLLDADFGPRGTVPATGLPSRSRLSPDGRMASMTFFLWESHGYAQGDYATQTQIVDVATGEALADLESFSITRDGERFQSVDFNYWGVTFARDSNRFYATLASGGKTYLIEGDVAARQARVLRENVECPSLSPDNTRLVFKKRVDNGPPAVWRLHLLDLTTMHETPLNEVRNVDDQVEWLDDRHILYTPPTSQPDIWVAAVDGSAPPRIFVTGAVSPAVIR